MSGNAPGEPEKLEPADEAAKKAIKVKVAGLEAMRDWTGELDAIATATVHWNDCLRERADWRRRRAVAGMR